MGHRPDWNNKNFKKNSIPGFADGTIGGVDEREAAREGFTVNREPTVDTYEYGRYEEMQANKDRYEKDMAQMDRDAQEASRELSTIAESKREPKKAMSFSQAFAENRKAGNKTFEWNGKQYSTEMAKAAPQGDQKVKKMYEQEAAVGRQLREAAAKVSNAKQRQIILDKAAESDVRAKQLGMGYAFSANTKK
jgi:hypothetical protein